MQVDERGEGVITEPELMRVLELVKKEDPNRDENDLCNARIILELMVVCSKIKGNKVDEVTNVINDHDLVLAFLFSLTNSN